MTRVLTKWLNVSWWDFRRSWKALRRERCLAWEDRWTSSSSRPWTLKTWANSFLDGNPGCDLGGSRILVSVFKQQVSKHFKFVFPNETLDQVNSKGLYLLVLGGCFGSLFVFFSREPVTKKAVFFSLHVCSPYSIKQPVLWRSLWLARTLLRHTGCSVL